MQWFDACLDAKDQSTDYKLTLLNILGKFIEEDSKLEMSRLMDVLLELIRDEDRNVKMNALDLLIQFFVSGKHIQVNHEFDCFHQLNLYMNFLNIVSMELLPLLFIMAYLYGERFKCSDCVINLALYFSTCKNRKFETFECQFISSQKKLIEKVT
jgi:hypothetical protein